MLEPYEGRVFDPCCGSGGMFVMSEKFVESHSDLYKQNKNQGLALSPADRISIFGQESNQTTWQLAKMNLAIRGIDSSNVRGIYREAKRVSPELLLVQILINRFLMLLFLKLLKHQIRRAVSFDAHGFSIFWNQFPVLKAVVIFEGVNQE
jgi:hypothetical protein